MMHGEHTHGAELPLQEQAGRMRLLVIGIFPLSWGWILLGTCASMQIPVENGFSTMQRDCQSIVKEALSLWKLYIYTPCRAVKRLPEKICMRYNQDKHMQRCVNRWNTLVQHQEGKKKKRPGMLCGWGCDGNEADQVHSPTLRRGK